MARVTENGALTALEVIVTSAITLTGLYLAYSFHRQQRIKIAEQRIDAYRKLWHVMEPARPSRLDPPDSSGPISAAEARELYDSVTAWYFENGNGVMLTEPTRAMYLEAKRRLGAYSSGTLDGADSGAAGERRMRELSLLRTQMKFDLTIYGVFHPDSLDHEDEAFVRSCGLNPQFWGRPLGQRLGIRRFSSRGQASGLRWPGGRGTDTPRAHD
jgi:hypothetical protein